MNTVAPHLLREEDHKRLSKWRTEFESGDKEAAFHAISWCLEHRFVVPDWAVPYFCGNWRKYTLGIPGRSDPHGKSTLGGVFGIVRPSNFKPAAHRRRGLSWDIYEFIEQEKSPEVPVDEYLFERAAEKVSRDGGIASILKRLYQVELPESESKSISGKTASRIYYEFLARMQRDKT